MSTDPKTTQAVAVASGKALDLAQGIGRFIAKALGDVPADAIGALGGDSLHHSRIRNLDRLQRETDRILSERKIIQAAEVPGVIALAVLGAAQDESRSQLQDIWATLLANAMDPERCNDIRVEFVDTLKKLHPRDVLVLKALRDVNTKQYHQIEDFAKALNLTTLAIEVSLDHLAELNCATPRTGLNASLRPYGRELLFACE